jgi:chloramphenicol-sensitive protein RarD
MQRSVALVLGAYSWWGLSALFWRELAAVDAVDQLAWRVVSAFVLLGSWLAVKRLRHRRSPASATPSQAPTTTGGAWLGGLAASLLITANWGAFLWAVSNGQAVEAALGYFLMPLFSAALGVLALGEKLRTRPAAALLLAACGVTWLIVVDRRLPVIALILGSTFALYGLAKKQTNWSAATSLMVEVAFIAPVMATVLVLRTAQGESVTGDGQPRTLALLVVAGLVTIVPLLLFAAAAQHVSLILIGLLQYLNPTLQFLVGWLVLNEPVDQTRVIGFSFVWLALAIIVFDQLQARAPAADARPGSENGAAPDRAADRQTTE